MTGPGTTPDGRSLFPARQETEVARVLFNETMVRGWYDEYVEDVAWYRDHGQLTPGHFDIGYRTGEPTPWERYRAEVVRALRDDLSLGPCYRVELLEVDA